MKASAVAFTFGLVLSSVDGVLIQCPEGLNTPENVQLGMTCGGTCSAKGSCADGFQCQKSCEAQKFPSASFAITEMGAPEQEGVCVVAVDAEQSVIPGGSMQQDICNDDVQAAAKEAMSQIDAQSNSMKSMQLAQVVQASSQVVNGIKWTFTLAAGISDCDKTAEYSLCETPVEDNKRDLYQVTLFDQAWMTPRYTLGEWKVMPRQAPPQARTMELSKDGKTENTKSSLRGNSLGGKGSIGPAWTYDSSVEKPAGEKDMGGWTEAVYTAEQQQRMGVDEAGKKVEQHEAAPAKIEAKPEAAPCMGCAQPAKPMDESVIEAAKKGVPMVLAAAGEAQGCDSSCVSTLSLGFHSVVNATQQVVAGMSYDMYVNLHSADIVGTESSVPAALPECHMKLWVRDWLHGPDGFQLTDWSCDDSVTSTLKTAAAATATATASKPLLGAGKGSIGPAWTYDSSVEKPAGEKDMGGWTEAVYTAEQQQRMGVDEAGKKVEQHEAAPAMFGGKGSIGPAWTYDSSVEKPAGEKDMGGWTEAVYTAEQQQRMGVDEKGQKKEKKVTIMKLDAASVTSTDLSDADTSSSTTTTTSKKAPLLSTGAAAAVGVAGTVAAVGLLAAMVVSRRKSRHARSMQLRTHEGETEVRNPYSVM